MYYHWKAQHFGFLNDVNVLILILHFDAQNGGEPNSPILIGSSLIPPVDTTLNFEFVLELLAKTEKYSNT